MGNNKITASIFASIVLFWIIAPFVPRMHLFDLINALSFVLGLFVLYAYWPGVVEAYASRDELKRSHYLILGIVATWCAMIARTVWLWTWRFMEEPEGGLDHIGVAFIAYLIVVGGTLHLIAPKVLEGEVPRSSWATLTKGAIIGVTLGLVIIFARLLHEAS
jgi:hypothetical protein